MSSGPLVELRGVTRTFEGGHLRALDDASLAIEPGEFVAIVGPSGCGKSTMLHLLAALDRPTSGSIVVGGHDLGGRKDLDHYRARDVGIVFQLDNLVTSLSASENVQLAMMGVTRSGKERKRKALELLRLVGLEGRTNVRPPQMSGGERQRVAIARALANDPPLLLADEPTGRLDSNSGVRVLELLEKLRDERGLTLVLVTHDPTVAARADRIVRMLDGKIVSEERLREAPVPAPAGASSPSPAAPGEGARG